MKNAKPKKVEHTDPITGEVTDHVEQRRVRVRDVFLDDLGRELPDPRPMQPPIGYKKQPSLFELVREATAREVALYAQNREPESLEESEDFDIPDDPIDPSTPWENDFDPPWSEVKRAIEEDRKSRQASESPPPPAPPSGGPAPSAERQAPAPAPAPKPDPIA